MDKSAEQPRGRAIAAQTIAVMVKNLILLDYGLSSAFPIILVPALTGLGSESDRDETLRITATEASWLGSMLYILFMVSSLFSGLFIEPMGRKKAMLLVNIPYLFGWLTLYFATTHTRVFAGMALLGVGGGLMESPVLTYVGEICEVSVRNMLVSTSGLTQSIGFLLMLFAALWFDWRTVALICASLPIASAIALSFIPESPIWLLSRYRDGDASKSLQWLRGWVSEPEIEKELSDLKRYREYASSCLDCRNASIPCSHPPPTLLDKVKEVYQPAYVKPIVIISTCSLFTSFVGAHHLNPYTVQILNTYQTPMQPSDVTIAFGITAVAGTILYTIIVKFASKRSIYLVGISMVAVLNLWLGLYGFYYLPANSKSFEHASSLYTGEDTSYTPFVLMIAFRFVTVIMLYTPNLYASELFPLKSRCFAAGIAVATTSMCLSVATKTFYNLENWLDMSSTFCIYGVIGFIGLYVSYKTLPLTEGRTLEEIEKHFSDNRKSITDWKITSSLDTTNKKILEI